MTKQEEIREGMILITKSRPMAYQLLQYLHSEGMVIKVEGELPEQPSDELLKGMAEENLLRSIWYMGTQDILKAGYVAVESLIKEGK